MSGDRAREVRVPACELPEPGRVAVVTIGHHRVGIMQVDGQIHALADRCPHRGAPLCTSGEIVTAIERRADGTLDLGPPGALIRCPWHRWDFDISTGTCPADPQMRVRTYPVRVEGQDVVVSLDQPER
jgi:nitrite reductase/ring-hydroxylating ferredoxin subunit